MAGDISYDRSRGAGVHRRELVGASNQPPRWILGR